MTTIAIATCTENGGIGIGTRFPWDRLYAEEETFTNIVKDNVVLIGSGTFNSHESLRGAITYVLTSNTEFVGTDVLRAITGKPEDVLARISEENPGKDIFISGGELVFDTFNELVDEWYVTVIEGQLVYDRKVHLARIKHAFPKHSMIVTGTDNNQNFTTWHYTK